jgi:hypothetical protein
MTKTFFCKKRINGLIRCEREECLTREASEELFLTKKALPEDRAFFVIIFYTSFLF